MATGGGIKAIKSVLRYSRQIGPVNLFRALKSKNACKACAFGTGGQKGGIFNESGSGIEFCNKNVQAHLSDIREGIPNTVFLQRSIAELGKLSGKQLEDLGRLAQPLYKKSGDTHYSPISYEEGLSILVDRLKATQAQRTFFYASGRSSNEAAFTLQLFARLYGTNNVNNCSFFCHQASGVGLGATIGTGTATIEYNDLDQADTIFVMGANPASNHPRFIKCLLKCRRRGGKVIVVNPAKEPGMVRFASPSDWRSMIKGGESVASHYVQPHLGGDLAFLQGLAKVIIERGLQDDHFIQQYTQGFEAYSAHVSALQWHDIEKSSGVSEAQIREIADLYAQSENTVFTWSMGLTHHVQGVDNIEAVVALSLLRGMIGRPGAGLLPLRGHSNIQGVGSMGFTPALKKAVEDKLEQLLGESLPTEKGLDTMACMEASTKGDMDAAIMLGGNLLASNPDTKSATQALSNVPFKCFINPTINQSHVLGVDQEVLILPIKVRDEESQATSQESMFNFVRLSDGGIERFPQLWSEVDIICEFASRVVDKSRFDFALFRNYDKIREFVGHTVPGFDKISNLGNSKEEFHIDGRLIHAPKFATADGKAHFKCASFNNQQSDLDTQEFTLGSVRSEGQFNSIIFHEYDSYRDQTERNVLLMNRADMRQLSLSENQLIHLESDTGVLENLKVKPFDVRRGNVLTYYPEANVLIPKNIDARSMTPSFKAIAVRICVEDSLGLSQGLGATISERH